MRITDPISNPTMVALSVTCGSPSLAKYPAREGSSCMVVGSVGMLE